jgi:hypothetical protein
VGFPFGRHPELRKAQGTTLKAQGPTKTVLG